MAVLDLLADVTKIVVIKIAMFMKYIRKAQYLSSPELPTLIFILLDNL